MKNVIGMQLVVILSGGATFSQEVEPTEDYAILTVGDKYKIHIGNYDWV